jgi:chromosome segregation ATPase
MTQSEYRDRQELKDKVVDYSRQAENLGEQQEGHQVDLESLQDRLKALKEKKGLYSDSDQKMLRSVESAINTRESSVENCKSQIKEVGSRMQTVQSDLQRAIPKIQERVGRMEDVVSSLKHSDVTVNINVEIQRHKDDIEDANDKSSKIIEVIQVIGDIAASASVSAANIGGFISALRAIGLLP